MDEFSDLGSCETCPLSGVFWPAGGLSLRGTWGQRGDSAPGLASRVEGGPGGERRSWMPPALYPHPTSSGARPRAVPAAPGLAWPRRGQVLWEHLLKTLLWLRKLESIDGKETAQGRAARTWRSQDSNPGFMGFWALLPLRTVPAPLLRPQCTCSLLHMHCTHPHSSAMPLVVFLSPFLRLRQ